MRYTFALYISSFPFNIRSRFAATRIKGTQENRLKHPLAACDLLQFWLDAPPAYSNHFCYHSSRYWDDISAPLTLSTCHYDTVSVCHGREKISHLPPNIIPCYTVDSAICHVSAGLRPCSCMFVASICLSFLSFCVFISKTDADILLYTTNNDYIISHWLLLLYFPFFIARLLEIDY